MNMRRPEPGDVLDAHERLDGIALRTPLLRSDELDARAGGKVFVKCESLQRSGAFKFRGAYNCLSRLDHQAYPGGVVAYSTGNHGQAVATVGRMLRIPTTIVMPYDAPSVKIAKARAQGAEVVLYDRHKESREEIAAGLASVNPVAIIPPGDDPFVIAGQGTAAGEALQTLSGINVDIVLVPCGGGGLAAGSCLAVEAFQSGSLGCGAIVVRRHAALAGFRAAREKPAARRLDLRRVTGADASGASLLNQPRAIVPRAGRR